MGALSVHVLFIITAATYAEQEAFDGMKIDRIEKSPMNCCTLSHVHRKTHILLHHIAQQVEKVYELFNFSFFQALTRTTLGHRKIFPTVLVRAQHNKPGTAQVGAISKAQK